MRSAVREIGHVGWAASLLKQQWPDGHWSTPGTTAAEMYRPKFEATFWPAIVLADLGMTRADPRIRRTAELLLDRCRPNGNGPGQPLDYRPSRGGEICVTGMLVRALIRFGYLDHADVQRSIAWIVRTQKPDGGWHCIPSRTGTLDDWKGLAALAEIPPEQRDGSVRRTIERGAEFYLGRHLMDEGGRRYPPWFRIHYPDFYYYDLLVGLRILTRLGYGSDRRLGPAVRWLRRKRRPDGTWALDAVHPDFDPALTEYRYDEILHPLILETVGQPSRWATVEALNVLARLDAS
ncbi:MAG: prenyltransferase/squalene oxidase repeat-containing protein [Thermoplasmata archaeon]